MGEIGARDFCNDYFIVFADLRFQITNPPMGDRIKVALRRHLPRLVVSSNDS